VTGGRVENRLGKKQRTGRVRAGGDDVAIKAFCINDAAVGDGEDERDPGRVRRADGDTGIMQGRDAGGRRKAGTRKTGWAS